MRLYTSYYPGKDNEDEDSVPKETESLIITEAAQSLPEKFCKSHFQLRKVVFCSDGIIESIPTDAFEGCSALLDIVIPSTVTAIGDRAFSFCTSLTQFAFPQNLRTLGKHSFVACNLTQLSIPGSVEVISESSFSGCSSLLQVELLEGVKVIGPYAFASCFALVDFSIPSTVQVIGETAFGYCQSLRTLELPRGLRKIGRRVFDQARSLQSIGIPSTVEHLEEYAFFGCMQLKHVLLEHGLRTIGLQVFCECKQLSSISIPSTVEAIGDLAFECCESLVEVTIVRGNLKTIGEEAFVWCSNLQSIYIPSTVRQVGDRAFANCTNLVAVEIPEASESSFGQSFNNCPLLANMAIPKTVHPEEIVQSCTIMTEIYGESNVYEGMKSRFEEHPIHKVSYYSWDDGSDFRMLVELKSQSGLPNLRDYTYHLVDPFGMTPFHVLMSAPRKRLDLLQLLLDYYPPHVLRYKNRNGAYALDYLVRNWTDEAKSMAKMALQKWMVEGMQSWGLPEWRSVMEEKVAFVLSDDLEMDGRKSALHEACRLIRRYERMEATSLLELWLWKMKAQSIRNGAKRMAIDHQNSRTRSGADFIVPLIVDCLWE